MKRRLLCLLAVISVSFAACGGDRQDAQPTPAGSPTARPRPLPSPARSSADVDPVFHVGQEIFITEDGFLPATLVAIIDEEISFINETDDVVEIEFDPGDFKSGPIKPGKRATYTSTNAQAISYERADDGNVKGFIQVEPYFEPGEDPAAEDRQDAD